MTGTVLYKMSGSGNDFVVVDGRTAPLDQWSPDRIRAVCTRGTGVGADGLVVLEPGSAHAAVRFHFFNSDGGRASMCGNAALCATRMAAWLELAPADGMVLETDAGRVEARCMAGPPERAELVLPATSAMTAPEVDLAPGERSIHIITVGVPHLVVLVDDVAAVPLVERGRELRSHPVIAPAGANVNFVAQRSGEWAMRTYERGVEDETLACATGAVAAAAALARVAHAKLPIEIRTASGEILAVSGQPADDGHLECPCVAGEGRLVFRAILGA